MLPSPSAVEFSPPPPSSVGWRRSEGRRRGGKSISPSPSPVFSRDRESVFPAQRRMAAEKAGGRRARTNDPENGKAKIEIAISSHLRWENGCCSQEAMCTKERLIPSGIRKGERDKEIIESSSFFFFLAFYYSALTKRWLLLSVHHIFVSPYLFPPSPLYTRDE